MKYLILILLFSFYSCSNKFYKAPKITHVLGINEVGDTLQVPIERLREIRTIYRYDYYNPYYTIPYNYNNYKYNYMPKYNNGSDKIIKEIDKQIPIKVNAPNPVKDNPKKNN